MIESSLHGRERRMLRQIEKTDIEECLAYGIREPSIKGRWKYTYNEVVLIMDPTNTTEITSFIMPLEMERAEYDNCYVEEHNEAKRVIIEDKSVCASHTIIVMDMSGSMNESDVSNFITRYDAVVSNLASEYIASQLIHHQVKNSDVVTIIRMGTQSDVLIEREPVSWVLYNMVLDLKMKRPSYHGNYIPALRGAKELFDKYDHPNTALSLFFLSDGKPSDACYRHINYDICKGYIFDELRTLAIDYVSRLSTNFIGFGRYTYDFEILENLSKISEEIGCVSQFIHSKLDSTILKDSFNSSAKRLSETRISLTMAGGRTLRPSLGTKENPTSSYFFYPEVQNKVWSSIDNNWILKPFAQGIALCKDTLGIGAERVVFSLHLYDHHHDSASEEALSAEFRFKQSELVGKESKFMEDVQSSERFHKTFIITQQKASELASAFNSSISKLPSFCNNTTPLISFLDCYLFYVPRKQISILVEKRLDIKKYKKFNDNMGGVDGQASHPPINLHKGLNNMSTMLNAIQEVEDDDDDDDDEEDDSNLARMERVTISPSESNKKVNPDHIPQAFSHFTHRYSNRKLLVCDLQGVFNADTIPPTYVLTDPVIHYKSSIGRKNTFGRTDCGKQGMKDFFRTHICNPLCMLVIPQKKRAQKSGRKTNRK